MQRIVHKIFSDRYLFYTNSLGAGLIMGLGDTIMQSIDLYTQPDKRGYDLRRTAHMGIIGLCMGPPQHVFYKYLDKFLPKRSLRTVAYKVCLDLAIISPVCISIFLVGTGLLEAKSRQDIAAEFRDKFVLIFTTDAILWPPCQFVNFTYVRGTYRVLYVNVITLIDNAILSYIKYADDERPESDEK